MRFEAYNGVIPLVVFTDSKAIGAQALKDELARLKKCKRSNGHVTERLTNVRVQFIHQLIVANLKQSKTKGDAMELFSILEALIKSTNYGVTLIDFPDLAFGKVAIAFYRNACSCLKATSRLDALEDLQRALCLQSVVMCTKLLDDRSDDVKDLKGCLREMGSELTSSEKSNARQYEKQKAKRVNGMAHLKVHIEHAKNVVKTLKPETSVTSPILREWCKINDDVRGDLSISRAEVIGEIHIRFNKFLDSNGGSNTSAKKKRKLSNVLD
jgi:hypothetical protein